MNQNLKYQLVNRSSKRRLVIYSIAAPLPRKSSASRKSERRRDFNRSKRQTLKAALKNLAAAKTKDEAAKLLPGVQSLIDKSAKRQIVHHKTAGRLKSRLAREAADLK